MKKLLIFDLDGTLVNSLEDLADAVNIGLQKMGYSIHDVEKYRYFVGNGALKLCERALPENARSKENIDTLKNHFAEYYAIHFCDKTALYDGIAQLLCKLKQMGIMLAVASNKPHCDCLRIASKLFDDGLIDIVSGGDNGFDKKPAPDIVLDIMQRCEVSACETLFIGDSDVDIKTAKNAQIESVGCLWGFRTQQELAEAGADFIAKHPLDILNFIK